jgi:signal-transduction protein with cAMP-binding, CBS, and nucleotidyltransferase domain
MTNTEILKKAEPFSKLSNEQLKAVEEICTKEVFELGDMILKQDKDEKFHVIEDGLVGIIYEVGPLSQRQVQTASKYDIFGWSSLIEPFKCRASVKAIKKTSTLSFNGQDLFNLCSADPELGLIITRGLFNVVRQRLREAYIQLLGVTGHA